MNQNPEKVSKQSEQVSSKPRKDPRHIITPDAFHLDESLLGRSLATPKRRALAMTLDLIIIQQLSHIGSFVLGLALAMVFFMLSGAKGKKSVGNTRKSVFRILGILMLLFVVATEIWEYKEHGEFKIFGKTPELSEVVHEEINSTISSELSFKEQLEIANEKIIDLEQKNRVLRADDDSNFFDLLEALARKMGYGFGWAAVYFTLSIYLLKGQTPAKWLCRIRVIQLDGNRITIWNAFGRYGGYAASLVTGLAGFFQILWDPNRQGLHDKVAGTVVVRE